MAIYHKANNRKVVKGDTVVCNGIELEVSHVFEYTHRGAGVCATAKHSTVAHFREYMCSSVGCFHSTGNADIFNGETV